MASFRRQRLDQDLAEAELARSEAALAAGELAAARRWAAAAERRFRRQGNDAWADLAAADPAARAADRRRAAGRPIAAEAMLLAGRLRGRGLANDADMAELLAARALLAAGLPRRGEAADRGRAPPRTGGHRWTSACCAGWPGPSWPSGKGGPGRRWPSSGLAWPWCRPAAAGSAASTCRPAPRPSAPTWPRPACGWRWSAGRRRWCSPGWNAPGRRRSGSGRCARPPTRRPRRSLAELRQLSHLIREAELDGSRDPATGRQARRAAARDQGARLAGRRAAARPPPRPASARSARPWQRSGQTPGRASWSGRPDARGGGAARIGAPDPARRLRRRPPRPPGG